MSDESILNLSDSTKAMMRNYAMVAGFFAIFIHSMLIACFGFTGGESSFAPSYIVSAILLISGTVLVLLHKRDMTAIMFMMIGTSYLSFAIGFSVFGMRPFAALQILMLVFGVMFLLTKNEQKWICAALMILYGLNFITFGEGIQNPQLISACIAVPSAILSGYAGLCIGLESPRFPGYSLLTADEADETKDGEPAHFKIMGSVLGYFLYSAAMFGSAMFYIGGDGTSLDRVIAMETICGTMLILVGLLMLIAGRMRFTPFMFIMLGTVTSLSFFLGDLIYLSFVFSLVVGLLCIFRKDRRLLVGVAVIMYGLTYALSAMIIDSNAGALFILNIIPFLILMYVSYALITQKTDKLF